MYIEHLEHVSNNSFFNSIIPNVFIHSIDAFINNLQCNSPNNKRKPLKRERMFKLLAGSADNTSPVLNDHTSMRMHPQSMTASIRIVQF